MNDSVIICETSEWYEIGYVDIYIAINDSDYKIIPFEFEYIRDHYVMMFVNCNYNNNVTMTTLMCFLWKLPVVFGCGMSI